jgi:hypothetical protein
MQFCLEGLGKTGSFLRMSYTDPTTATVLVAFASYFYMHDVSSVVCAVLLTPHLRALVSRNSWIPHRDRTRTDRVHVERGRARSRHALRSKIRLASDARLPNLRPNWDLHWVQTFSLSRTRLTFSRLLSPVYAIAVSRLPFCEFVT